MDNPSKPLPLIPATELAALYGVAVKKIALWREKGALNGWVAPTGELFIERESADRLRLKIGAALNMFSTSDDADITVHSSSRINMHAVTKFNPVTYFHICSESTLHALEEMTDKHQVMCLPVMQKIVQDNRSRSFSDIIRHYGSPPLHGLVLSFSKAIHEGKMTRPDGWNLRWELKHYKDDMLLIRNLTAEAKMATRSRECVRLTKAPITLVPGEATPTAT